jgi:hypothetical protein
MKRFSFLAGTVAAALLMGCSGGEQSTSQSDTGTAGAAQTVNTTEVVLKVPGMS